MRFTRIAIVATAILGLMPRPPQAQTVTPLSALVSSGHAGPTFLAVDRGGNLYVSNEESGTISKIDAGGRVSTFANGLAKPAGLAFDNHGNLYVANADNGKISKITASGGVSHFVDVRKPESHFDWRGRDPYGRTVITTYARPSGLAFDRAGNLYAADRQYSDVSRIMPDGSVGVFAEQLSQPTGLTFDSAGDLYVAWRDYKPGTGDFYHRISKITPSGHASVFVSDGLDEPTGLAFDKSGILHVANSSSISSVAADGRVSIFAVSPINDARGIAFDRVGNLYVANNGDHTISKITPDGRATRVAKIKSPEALAFDASGNLYVSGVDVREISKISRVAPDGSVTIFAALDSSDFAIDISAVAIDKSGNLYMAVASRAVGKRHEIRKVTPDGKVTSLPLEVLAYPSGLAFDERGNLHVANRNTGTIIKVTAAGSVSTLARGLDKPGALVFDGNGNLYVASRDRVSKITRDGHITTFANESERPSGLAFNATGNLIVANSTGVRKITPSGVASVVVNDEFTSPRGLSFDDSGNLYVSDYRRQAGKIYKIPPRGGR
jgi:sugar lactone lactonase YvrE